MKNWAAALVWVPLAAVAAAICVPPPACAASKAYEMPQIEFLLLEVVVRPGSRKGQKREAANYHYSETILAEDPSGWLERILTEQFDSLEGSLPPAPQEVYARVRTDIEVRTPCPGKSNWSVLDDAAHRLIFERRMDACEAQPATLTLGMVIRGRRAHWLLTYDARLPLRDPQVERLVLTGLFDAEVLEFQGPGQLRPTWGPTVGPKWLETLLTEHVWSDGRDVLSELPIPDGWQLTDRTYDIGPTFFSTLWFMPPGVTSAQDSEVLRLQRAIDYERQWDNKGFVERLERDLRKSCGTKAKLEVMQLDTDRSLVQVVTKGCTGENEFQAVLHIRSERSAFRQHSEFSLIYAKHTAVDLEQLRQEWRSRMMAIRIEPVP